MSLLKVFVQCEGMCISSCSNVFSRITQMKFLFDETSDLELVDSISKVKN